MWVETARHAVRGLLRDRSFSAASLLLLWTTLLVAGSVGGASALLAAAGATAAIAGLRATRIPPSEALRET